MPTSYPEVLEQSDESGDKDNASESWAFEHHAGRHRTSGRAAQKRKLLAPMGAFCRDSAIKKRKRRNTNSGTRSASRKSGKKNRVNVNPAAKNTSLITLATVLLDGEDDSPNIRICLSKIHKAEKIELSK